MTFREALNYPLEQSDPSPWSYHKKNKFQLTKNINYQFLKPRNKALIRDMISPQVILYQLYLMVSLQNGKHP